MAGDERSGGNAKRRPPAIVEPGMSAGSFTLAELAARLDGEIDGDGGLQVEGIDALALAGARQLAVVFDAAHAAAARASTAGAFVAAPGLTIDGRPVVRVAAPRVALIELLELFHPQTPHLAGIEPGAFVAESAAIGAGVWVAAGARIEDGAELAAGVAVHAHAVVGRGTTIGPDCVLHPHVVLYPGTRLGSRVEIHAGSVIGRPGFGYHRDATGRQRRIPQVGWVEIEDDVEIGVHCAIDRATFGATRVRRGTKIDNLVQIGHNSDVGEDCCIVAQVGISGSVEIGARNLLSGQVGVADHAVLDADTRVGAQSGVVGHLDGGEWIGYPALPAPRARRVYGLLARLPELFRELRSLRAECADLHTRLAAHEQSGKDRPPGGRGAAE